MQTQNECPRCGSPEPKLHPAMQYEGEVQVCNHSFHGSPPPLQPGQVVDDETYEAAKIRTEPGNGDAGKGE